jgi:hypothetical protein
MGPGMAHTIYAQDDHETTLTYMGLWETCV